MLQIKIDTLENQNHRYSLLDLQGTRHILILGTLDATPEPGKLVGELTFRNVLSTCVTPGNTLSRNRPTYFAGESSQAQETDCHSPPRQQQ